MKKIILILFLLSVITHHANAQGISFTSDAEAGCAPLTVHFTNTSTVGTTYTWVIDSGPSHPLYTEYGTDMTYVFTYPAYFHILLTAYDASANCLGGCHKHVYIPGYYTMQLSSDTVCPGDKVFFTYNGNADALLWQFGDGNAATGSQVTHAYATAGEYYPRVISVNMCSRDTLTFSNPVIVTNSLPAAMPYFNMYPSKICPGATVHFSTYPAQAFTSLLEWDFGDGNTMVTQDLAVDHQYSSLGSYTVTLTRSNNCGNQNSYSRSIIVSDTLPPTAPVIYAQPMSSCNSFQRTFGVNYGNHYDIQSFLWDFGDGDTDTAAVAEHVYGSAGTYIVTLTFTNFCGNSGSASDTVIIANPTQTFGAPPFLIYPYAACPNDTIYMGDYLYTFTPTGNNVSVYWDFGDGNSDTSKNTSHIYTYPGTYLVTRTLTNACGNSASVSDTVVISNSVIPPVTPFAISPGESCPGDVVRLGYLPMTGNSPLHDNLFYIWNYDDGAIDTTHSAFTSHSFTGLGNYLVTLTIANRCGNQSSFTDTVKISNNLQVPFFYWNCWTQPYSTNLNACENIFFSATGNEGYTYEWDFGDGNSVIANTNTTSHAFSQEDIYLVTVTATNGCGNSKTYSHYIIITGVCLSVDDIFSAPSVILAYPNPASEQLNISYKDFFLAELFSIDGKKVLTVMPQENQPAVMDVSTINDGIYFLKIMSGKNYLTQKVIVIH